MVPNPGTHFQRLIPDPMSPNPENVKQLLMCSGKVYYELVEQRKKRGRDDNVAITRIEQVPPPPPPAVTHSLLLSRL